MGMTIAGQKTICRRNYIFVNLDLHQMLYQQLAGTMFFVSRQN